VRWDVLWWFCGGDGALGAPICEVGELPLSGGGGIRF
jgi:hypothetical protein